MTHWMQTRAALWLLFGLIFTSLLAIEVPTVEAQEGSECRRHRRSRSARARHARARRARARRARLAANTPAVAPEDPSAPVDMDFSAHFDAERPPPMDTSYVEEVEQEELEERRAMLDPELFGSSESAQASAPAERGRFSPLTARIAARAFHRGLGYRDYESGAVANYDLPLGAAALVAVDYYPAAHVLNDAWAHLGLSWAFVHSIAVESIGPNNIGYPTNAYQWQIGLRYRVPLDEAGGEIAFEAGYGETGFHVERGPLGNPAPEGVPAVDYDHFRLAVSGRFMIGDAAIGGRVGYLPAIETGAIASEAFFGGAEAHGVEAALDFSYALGLGFEILAEIDMRLFVLDFAETDGAGASAAGALDRYVGANVGLRWRMPAHAEL